ncbi:MAG TPA: hypothetical protein VJ813_14535 [Vicinamibacterales bacterium]|nr:hypothetical protein [Vicinamibacterales bacterium]
MRRTALAAALVFLGLAPAPAGAEWVRVESPNFVVFGEVGEKHTREYAAEFERFREALGRIVPGAAARPAAPAVVFIFKDARSFDPHRPLYNGKPVQVTGYFVGGPSLDVIMLPATNRDAALRTIYHEYSHLITVNMARGLPTWLGEGLAEYYSTFEVRPDGRRAVLGGVIPSHLARLARDGLLPLDQLLTVEPDSPLYNEGSRRSTFYAQSWALVHMLRNGKPDRSAQFNEYVTLTAAGRSATEAWQQVFGNQKILEQLRRYIRQSEMTGYLFTFDRALAPATFSVSRPAPADIHAALGELRLHVEPAGAAAHMDQSPAPTTAFTSAVQGLIRLEENKHDEALDLLIAAARGTDDWLVQYRAAVGLERLATASQTESARTAGRAADAALQNVLRRRPDLPHAVALRAMVLGPGDEGLALIERARALAPGRAHYAIWQAQFHSMRGEFASARALLGPLMSTAVPSETREYARNVMSQAVTAEQARTRSAARTGGATDSPGDPPRFATGFVVPLFRELRAGEQRLEAAFERIECPRDGLILHVRIGGRLARYSAATFEAVEFLSYRDDLTGPVRCGPRVPPDRIYLTWRPATGQAGSDGIAVAVEFLPR